MFDKKVYEKLREHTKRLAKAVPALSLSDRSPAEIEDCILQEFLSVTDELLADDKLLNALIEHSSKQKGVSMSFDEIVKWWQDQNVRTSDDLEAVLDNFKIVFACNSNGIEGSTVDYHTTREVFEGNALSNFNGTARDIFETQNQKYAFEYFAKCFGNNVAISAEMIKKLHSIMMYGCYDEIRWKKGERPGQFKKGDYCIGIDSVGSYPDEVEGDIQELLNEMQENEGADGILTKAAYLHVCFETIHPFADGNGRVGRTLMNYYLIQHNYPPVVIFNEDKEIYYLALEVYCKTGKLSGVIKFLQEQMVKTWDRKIESRRGARFSEVKRLSAFLE